jgi:hypothetical protein
MKEMNFFFNKRLALTLSYFTLNNIFCIESNALTQFLLLNTLNVCQRYPHSKFMTSIKQIFFIKILSGNQSSVVFINRIQNFDTLSIVLIRIIHFLILFFNFFNKFQRFSKSVLFGLTIGSDRE